LAARLVLGSLRLIVGSVRRLIWNRALICEGCCCAGADFREHRPHMSKTLPLRPRLAPKATLTFAIVASKYNAQFVQPLVDHTFRELNMLEPGATIKLVSAPGSFEIPLLVKTLAEKDIYNAIIALGVLVQGETAHAMLVAQAVTNALMDISIAHHVPVIHEVLLVENEAQARARCIDGEINRGLEAARAAVASARSLREIR